MQSTEGSGEDRATRERARFDQGLDNRYRNFLARSAYHFERFRISLGAAEIRRFEAPRVLELGGRHWVKYVAWPGCEVSRLVCVNISETELEKGREVARRLLARPDLVRDGLSVPEFRRMDAHAMDFEDASFDVVFGGAMLHHLDLPRALAEIDRVLAPGGVMFFHEPMDMNPVGRLVRRLTPAARTEDERPFRMRDLALLRERFACRFEFTELLTVPTGALATALGLPADGRLMRTAFRADRAVARIPGLRTWCRHVFVIGRKPAA